MTGLISKRLVLADRWRLEVQDKCDWSLLVSTTCVSGWIDRGSSPTVREGSVIFLRLGRRTVRKGSAFPAGSSFYLSLEGSASSECFFARRTESRRLSALGGGTAARHHAEGVQCNRQGTVPRSISTQINLSAEGATLREGNYRIPRLQRSLVSNTCIDRTDLFNYNGGCIAVKYVGRRRPTRRDRDAR